MSEHAQCAHLSRAPRHDQGVRAIAIFIAFEELWQVECDDRSQRQDTGKLPRTCIFWFKATTLSLGGVDDWPTVGTQACMSQRRAAPSCVLVSSSLAAAMRPCDFVRERFVGVRSYCAWVVGEWGCAAAGPRLPRALTIAGTKVAAASPASKLFVDVLADMPWESAGGRRSGAFGLHRLRLVRRAPERRGSPVKGTGDFFQHHD